MRHRRHSREFIIEWIICVSRVEQPKEFRVYTFLCTQVFLSFSPSAYCDCDNKWHFFGKCCVNEGRKKWKSCCFFSFYFSVQFLFVFIISFVYLVLPRAHLLLLTRTQAHISSFFIHTVFAQSPCLLIDHQTASRSLKPHTWPATTTKTTRRMCWMKSEYLYSQSVDECKCNHSFTRTKS